MRLEELSLQDFRNYEQLAVQFNPGINVLIGENAQGKTNLLEAIHLLALTRSHRTNKDKELVNWQAKVAQVKGVVVKATASYPWRSKLVKGANASKLTIYPKVGCRRTLAI